jgi:hypothetical protein
MKAALCDTLGIDPFWQAPAPGEKGLRGLGLGLALVKSLVERHGGTVAAYSDGLGAGAEFMIRVPVCSRDGRTSPPPCSPARGNRSPTPVRPGTHLQLD